MIPEGITRSRTFSVQCGTTPSNSNTSIQRPLARHRVMLSRRVIAYYGLIRASESLPATYGFAAGSAAPKENRNFSISPGGGLRKMAVQANLLGNSRDKTSCRAELPGLIEKLRKIGLRWESRGSPIDSAGLGSRAASHTPVSRRVQMTVASSSVLAFTSELQVRRSHWSFRGCRVHSDSYFALMLRPASWLGHLNPKTHSA